MIDRLGKNYKAHCVIVVDDDVIQLAEATDLVQGLGHLVTACSTPFEVIALQGLDGYDVLLSDVDMPGMSGVALAEWLCVLHPRIRIILMSGTTPDAALVRDGWAFCPKPVEVTTLQELLTF